MTLHSEIQSVAKDTSRIIDETMSTFLGKFETNLCQPCAVQDVDDKSSSGNGSLIKIISPPQGVVCGHRRKLKKIEPQFPASKRPVGNSWEGNAYFAKDEGYKCKFCEAEYSKKHAMQQHCRSHFPPEYQCAGCGDLFHLKTEVKQHYFVKCVVCSKQMKQGSLSNHMKRKHPN